MKPFRRLIGHQLCPRCKNKQLAIVLDGMVRKDGRIKNAVFHTEPDTNPACMWQGEQHSLTSEQASLVILTAESKNAEATGARTFAERSQPTEI